MFRVDSPSLPLDVWVRKRRIRCAKDPISKQSHVCRFLLNNAENQYNSSKSIFTYRLLEKHSSIYQLSCHTVPRRRSNKKKKCIEVSPRWPSSRFYCYWTFPSVKMLIAKISKHANKVHSAGKCPGTGERSTCKYFIRRQRKYKPDVSPYHVDLSSMKQVEDGHLQFSLHNTDQSSGLLALDIYTLEHRSLRVKINENNPLRKRYEVQHALVGEPKRVS